MAEPTPTLGDAAADSTGGTADSTASFAVPDDTLVLIGIAQSGGTSGVPVDGVSGFGATWALVADEDFNTGGKNLSVWQAFIETGSTDTIDIDGAGSASGYAWCAVLIPNSEVIQSATVPDTLTGGTANLAALASADSIVIAWSTGTTATTITDFTDLTGSGDVGHSTPNTSLACAWHSDDTSVEGTWSGRGALIAVEVAPLAGGETPTVKFVGPFVVGL